MITEDYCSYEVARMLKEKGFDEPCLQMWECGPDTKYLFRLQSSCYQNITEKDSCLAPTHQMAMKWLREVHYKYIEIYTDREQHNFKDIVFRPEIYDNDFDCLWTGNRFFTYEESVEAALKYALENLI